MMLNYEKTFNITYFADGACFKPKMRKLCNALWHYVLLLAKQFPHLTMKCVRCMWPAMKFWVQMRYLVEIEMFIFSDKYMSLKYA